MREARVWGVRAELLPRALRRVQAAEMEEALLHAAAADRMSKGLVRGDVWEELLRLGLRLMPPPAARPAQGNRGKISGQ
jgi:DNA polymerase-3 subunit delta